ncbi:hypothetical protein E5288_WYG001720 [Bos mutus]|uniref:Uncharacterized protein n=1 Tax=Bos mutus TaxID=72004 RepID=A0A6B0RPT2_9CETA|nr:hypothetical protein [Bos mutus]
MFRRLKEVTDDRKRSRDVDKSLSYHVRTRLADTCENSMYLKWFLIFRPTLIRVSWQSSLASRPAHSAWRVKEAAAPCPQARDSVKTSDKASGFHISSQSRHAGGGTEANSVPGGPWVSESGHRNASAVGAGRTREALCIHSGLTRAVSLLLLLQLGYSTVVHVENSDLPHPAAGRLPTTAHSLDAKMNVFRREKRDQVWQALRPRQAVREVLTQNVGPDL